MSGKASPVRIFRARNMTEAELCVAFLEGSGIRAEVENPHTHQVLAGVEQMLDQEAGIGVIVSSADADRAEAAVRAFAASGRPAGEDDGDDGDGGGEE